MAYPFSSTESSTEIREIIYQSFDSRNDLSMELLDALSAETKVSSAVELSLSHHLTRQYSSHAKQKDQNDTYVLTADSKYSTVKAVDDAYAVGDHALNRDVQR